MADEKVNENVGDEKEAPAKKEKKQKPPTKEGAIPMVLMIGGAFGGVVMIIVSVIIGTVIANKLFPPVSFPVAAVEEHHEENQHEDEHGKAKLKSFPEEDMEDDISLLQDGDWLTIDDCKAQTNVKGNASMMGIITIAAMYKPHYVEELSHKGFLTEAGKDGHGNPTPPGVNKESELYKRLKLNIKTALTSYISKHTADELQDMQSHGELADSLKGTLKKSFRDIGLIVGRVDITEFLVAKM